MYRPKIGIIGHLGSIGSRHYKNFKDLGCEVFGCDMGGDLRALIKCDAIVIASPTLFHVLHISQFQDYAIPLLVEKPVVMRRAEMMAGGLRNVKMVGYNLRFHSCVRKVREWLGAGLIGKPIWARFNCAQFNDRPDYRRDGVILNWSHEIDLAQYLLGPMEFVTCATQCHNNPLKEDLADIIVRHMPGCQTLIHLDYLTKPERRGFVIVGEAGSIDADLVSRQAFCKDANGGLLHNHFGRDSFDGNYIAEAQAFLDRLDGKEVIGCTAEEALAVVDICFKAKEC